ncbi:MAG: hypothetical protein AAFP70_16530 [Calditrichota bacterium]
MRHIIRQLFLIIFLAASFSISAQDTYPINSNKTSLNYEFLKPDINLGDEIGSTFLSGTHHFNIQLNLNSRLSLVGGIPIVNFNLTEDLGNENFNITGTEIGNPYIGFKFQRPGQSFFTEFGTRIPLVDSEDFSFAYSFGTLAEITERVEAFLPDILPIHLMFGNTFKNRQNGSFIGFRSGGAVWLNIGDGNGDGVEAILKNNIRAGLDNRQVRVSIIYHSSWLITEDDDFSDLFYNSLGFQTDLKFNTISPYVNFRKPLNENFENFTDFILTFGVRLHMP